MRYTKAVVCLILAAALTLCAVPLASAEGTSPGVNFESMPEALKQHDLVKYAITNEIGPVLRPGLEGVFDDIISKKITIDDIYPLSQCTERMKSANVTAKDFKYSYYLYDRWTMNIRLVFSTIPLSTYKCSDLEVQGDFVLGNHLSETINLVSLQDKFSSTSPLPSMITFSYRPSIGYYLHFMSETDYNSCTPEAYARKYMSSESFGPENDFCFLYPDKIRMPENKTGIPGLGTPSGYVPPLSPGEYEDTFRAQKFLESYSGYSEEKYPGAPYLKRATDWIPTPSDAFRNPKVYKANKDGFEGFYFLPLIQSVTGIGMVGSDDLFRNRYTYHLYLYDKARDKWIRKSIWSEKPLIFSPAREENGHVIAPKLIIAANSPTVILQYGYTEGSDTIGTLTHVNGYTDTDKGEHLLCADNIYIINDDVAVFTDKGGANHGSGVDIGGTVTDENGNDISGNIPGVHFPERPGDDSGFGEWVNYFFESIGNFFGGLMSMVQDAVDGCGSFFEFLAGTLSFLPPAVWGLITLGIALMVFLRIFGR